MEKTSVLIAILGIAIFVATITRFVAKNKINANAHFDEMQLQNRATGYKLGFMVTIACMLVVLFLMDDFVGLSSFVEPSLAIFIALMIGIVTFAIYCIRKEAFFRVGDKGTSYIVLCTVIFLMNGILSSLRIIDGTILENGRITFEHGGGLVCSVSFLMILITLIMKKKQIQRAEEEE